MKKIIVPSDFSETSKNAGRFAVKMANDLGDIQIILYNVFDTLVPGSDGTPLFNDTEARNTITLAALENVKKEISGETLVPIECVAEEGEFSETLARYTSIHGIDLVVMGMNGATRLEQVIIGSNTLRVLSKSSCPILIIPPEATYEKIRTVALASDLIEVENTTPVPAIKKVLDLFHPRVVIAHVDEVQNGEEAYGAKMEKEKLEKLLGDFNPEYAFIKKSDFVEGINSYAEKNHIDLIVTLPRRHSFLASLFKNSQTKKLAYHTHLPILAIQE